MALIRTDGAKASIRCIAGVNLPTNSMVWFKKADGTTGANGNGGALEDFSISFDDTNYTVTKTGSHKVYILQVSTYSGSPTVTYEEVTTALTITGYGSVIVSI